MRLDGHAARAAEQHHKILAWRQLRGLALDERDDRMQRLGGLVGLEADAREGGGDGVVPRRHRGNGEPVPQQVVRSVGYKPRLGVVLAVHGVGGGHGLQSE